MRQKVSIGDNGRLIVRAGSNKFKLKGGINYFENDIEFLAVAYL